MPEATPRAALRSAPAIGEGLEREPAGVRGGDDDMSQATTGAVMSAAAAATARRTRASCARGATS